MSSVNIKKKLSLLNPFQRGLLNTFFSKTSFLKSLDKFFKKSRHKPRCYNVKVVHCPTQWNFRKQTLHNECTLTFLLFSTLPHPVHHSIHANLCLLPFFVCVFHYAAGLKMVTVSIFLFFSLFSFFSLYVNVWWWW